MSSPFEILTAHAMRCADMRDMLAAQGKADESARWEAMRKEARQAADTMTLLTLALEAAQPYVDDAAAFPEQFKPGLVRKHANQVRTALALAHAQPTEAA